jgi:hypothetical protein
MQSFVGKVRLLPSFYTYSIASYRQKVRAMLSRLRQKSALGDYLIDRNKGL